MGPPGGGRNPITARIMRHFNYLAFTELEDTSKAKIFSTIVTWWLRKLRYFILFYSFHEEKNSLRFSVVSYRIGIKCGGNIVPPDG